MAVPLIGPALCPRITRKKLTFAFANKIRLKE